MIKVVDLPRGWELWGNTECHEVQVMPIFKKGGLRLHANEMAGHPDAAVVFHEVKRMVDIGDMNRVSPVGHLPFRTLDVARFALELTMKMMDRWNPQLKETGIDPYARAR